MLEDAAQEQTTESTEAVNDAESSFEETIAAKLDALGTEDDSAPDAVTADDTAEDATDPADGDGADGGSSSEDQQPVDNAAPTIPAAHIRSLTAYGWTTEEINAAAGTPTFAATAARIHQTRTAEIQKFAELGRRQKEQAGESASQVGGPAKLGLPDRDALVEKYGSEDLIDEILGPVKALFDQANALLPDMKAGQQAAEDARLAAVRTEVDSFFTASPMVPFAESYGASSADLTEEQVRNRVKLLQMADNIRNGAALRNEDIPVREAMAMAHDIVGANFKAAAIRKEIRGAVTTKAKSVTVRPGVQSAAPASKADPEQQLLKNAEERLKALGN